MATEGDVFPLELPIAKGRKQFFNTLAELRSWVNEQKESFAWLGDAVQKDGALQVIRNHQLEPVDTLARLLAQIEAAFQNNGNADSPIKQLRDIINQRYVQQPTPPMLADDAYAKAVRDEAASNPVVAGYLLAQVIGLGHPAESPRAFAGYWKAEALKNGFRGRVETETTALRQLSTNLNAELVRFKQIGAQIATDIANARDGGARLARLFRRRQRKQLEKQRQRFKELRTAATGRLNALEDTYDKKLALQAAVTYWKSKAKKHGQWAFAMFFITVAIVAFGVVGVGMQAIDLFETIAREKQPHVWEIGIVAVYATVLIYVMRLLVRVTMSQLHLQEDSAQRATMTETYLSLLREGKALQDDDRRLVLEILFRPINTGLLKEDSPASAYELLLSRLTGKPGI